MVCDTRAGVVHPYIIIMYRLTGVGWLLISMLAMRITCSSASFIRSTAVVETKSFMYLDFLIDR